MTLILSPSSFQCYLFHMYVGVRAGGGIGDEIEDPAGDEYELYRVVFDITFFFFVIVILLAIIQGEYLDSFVYTQQRNSGVFKCFQNIDTTVNCYIGLYRSDH